METIYETLHLDKWNFIIILWLYSPSRALAYPVWGFLQKPFNWAGLLVQRPTPNMEDWVSVFMTPETEWPSYTPRHWVPILVSVYDMHGLQWDYTLIPATTSEIWSLVQ
jgi:hypothetical protein